MRLCERIKNENIKEGELGLFYLAQAGFCIKTSKNKTIIIDAYLSHACERMFNFKRMIPSVIEAEEVSADLFLSTHHHADHLDPDTIPVVAKNAKTFFIGAPDCESFYKEVNISSDRYVILKEDSEWLTDDLSIKAIYADHGELAPEAVGFLVEIDSIKIYHAGDTAFRPKEILESLHTDVDIMIVPINGQYGNMNAYEACKLGEAIMPKILIPCHFWMFVEHVSANGVGDPATFVSEGTKLPASIRAMVMAPGEFFNYKKSTI